MNDASLRVLARRAGIAVDWTDTAGRPQTVAPDTLRRILAALGLPCRTPGDVAESEALLGRQADESPALIVGETDNPIPLGVGIVSNARAKLHLADGEARDVKLIERGGGWETEPIADIGYHRIEIGNREVAIAVTPLRCLGIDAVAPGSRLWGLAVQLYGLRRDGDGGIGDFGGALALAQGIARFGADAMALSPIHALFAARPGDFAPYSPSSRLFLNPLYADPALVFGNGADIATPDRATLIDWPARSRAKLVRFRKLFEDFTARPGPLTRDFTHFRAVRGGALERHARFEASDAAQRKADGGAIAEGKEVSFHAFLQWLAERSLAATQRAARDAGMRIGLIADLAVGVDPRGSDAATQNANLLTGLSIGAPPDLINPLGQNWGLTALSPHALARTGYRLFIDTLQGVMRHVGGIRIDHAMGLRRLWLVPDGAGPRDGAYLTYPFETMLRLLALESHRHRAIVIAEDLGTVPPGFSERLNAVGILGMSILWFERDGARFRLPGEWRRDAVAMTTTHDLPTVAGWWHGSDIEIRAALGFYGADRSGARAQAARLGDRDELWRALTRSGSVTGRRPVPRRADKIVDGAIRFVARAPSRLALIPLEDLIGTTDQPNLPGTIAEHPNWRRRQKATADKLLAADKVSARLGALKKERCRK